MCKTVAHALLGCAAHEELRKTFIERMGALAQDPGLCFVASMTTRR